MFRVVSRTGQQKPSTPSAGAVAQGGGRSQLILIGIMKLRFHQSAFSSVPFDCKCQISSVFPLQTGVEVDWVFLAQTLSRKAAAGPCTSSFLSLDHAFSTHMWLLITTTKQDLLEKRLQVVLHQSREDGMTLAVLRDLSVPNHPQRSNSGNTECNKPG